MFKKGGFTINFDCGEVIIVVKSFELVLTVNKSLFIGFVNTFAEIIWLLNDELAIDDDDGRFVVVGDDFNLISSASNIFSFGIIVGFCNFVNVCDCGDVESLLGLFTVLIVGLLLR